jgi:hypothetical protein
LLKPLCLSSGSAEPKKSLTQGHRISPESLWTSGIIVAVVLE